MSSPEHISQIPTLISYSRDNEYERVENRLSCLRNVGIERKQRSVNCHEEYSILPVVLAINPRSCYGKQKELKILINQYSSSLVFISESWSRENLPISDLLQIENFSVYSNVVQRQGRGGKPIIMVDNRKFIVTQLCPKIITVQTQVEAVWLLLKPRRSIGKGKIKKIAACSYYYTEGNVSTRNTLYDHFAESINLIKSKYGETTHFILSADSNRLDLAPILNICSSLSQVVRVPTRLNPPATLDTIITTLSTYYNDPETKPPVSNDEDNPNGKPSDHLVVLWSPKRRHVSNSPREYREIVFRPMTDNGLSHFGNWIQSHQWNELYQMEDVNQKAIYFQNLIFSRYEEFFPEKKFRVSTDDQPWVSAEVKALDRKRKREFLKHQKSEKWNQLNVKYQVKVREAK